MNDCTNNNFNGNYNNINSINNNNIPKNYDEDTEMDIFPKKIIVFMEVIIYHHI